MALKESSWISVSICSLLSVIGCIWLLCTLRHFNQNRNRRSRPFPKQLISLAFADILFHTAQFAVCQVDYGPTVVADSLRFGCTAFMTAQATFRSVSVLNELNLALTFLCQALRHNGVHVIIQWGISFSWFFGLALIFPWEIFSVGWHWVDKDELCMFSAKDWIGSVLIVSSGLLCLISYIVVVRRSVIDTPGSVLHDYFRMAAIYPLNFVVTYGGASFIYIGSGLFDNNVFFAVSATLEALGGFTNVVTYAWLSRRLRLNRTGSQCQRGENFPSFRVMIGPEEVIDCSYIQSWCDDSPMSGESEPADGAGEAIANRAHDREIPSGT